jgi:hypothetical protein
MESFAVEQLLGQLINRNPTIKAAIRFASSVHDGILRRDWPGCKQSFLIIS